MKKTENPEGLAGILAAIVAAMKNGYVWVGGVLSGFLACYIDIDKAIYLLIAATILDTISAINAQAVAKGLVFNPFKRYFWLMIKSTGLKMWGKKVFREYFVYILLAFMVDRLVLKGLVIVDVHHWQLKLPVVVIYFLAFIEIWSIGENIEKTGRPNYIKKLANWFLPDKYKKFLPGNEDKPTETEE